MKIIALLVIGVYIFSVGFAYYLLHISQTKTVNAVTFAPHVVKRLLKNHKRPEALRIGHPLLDNCSVHETYEKLLLRPYHSLEDVHVYSAFFDNRTGIPFVRMISLLKRKGKNGQRHLWCNFAFDLESKSSVKELLLEAIEFYEMCENHHFLHGGWILSCKIPLGKVRNNVPCVFRLSADGSDKSIMIPLLKTSDLEREHKKEQWNKFGICVPPLYGNIAPETIVKFVAFSSALGVDHAIFYVFNVTDMLGEVLEFLEESNSITIIPWKLPIESNHVWYYGQSLAINDCLYRNMYYFNYLGFTDLDEHIVSHDSERTLMSYMNDKYSTNNKISAFRFPSAFFIRNPASKGHNSINVLDHIYRTEHVSRIRSKVVVQPYKIFEVGIHHVSRSWPDHQKYVTHEVDPEDAMVHHYRYCTPTRDLKCSSFITDSTVPDWYSFYFKRRYNLQMNELKIKFNFSGKL